MAYRFTNTDKWSDAWFSELKPMQKLLFNYLCDNCDIAGFIELNQRRWAFDIGTDIKTIEGAFEGLQRGFKSSLSGDCIFIKNYLKHQKNWPLDPEKNPAHRGIIKRFELYSDKFNCNSIEELFEAPSEGLGRGIGNSKGNGNGSKGGLGEKPEPKFNFKNALIELGVEEIVVDAWLLIRKKKKAVNSEIAFNAIKKQIDLSGSLAKDCITKAVERSWAGFEAEWYHNSNGAAKKVFNSTSTFINVKNDSSY